MVELSMTKTKETKMIPMIQPTNDINGTCLQGYITIKYSEIVEVLGKPQMTDCDKITAEWSFKAYDGLVFTIYDYKTYGTPKGVYNWHIGGLNKNVLPMVQALFPNYLVKGDR
jgi:hypothetical protein